MKRVLRPIVGIMTYAEKARWGAWDVPTALIPLRTSARSRTPAAARFSCRCPTPGRGDARHAGRNRLPGGSDLDPALYGAEAHAETTGTRPDRDRAEPLRSCRRRWSATCPCSPSAAAWRSWNVARGGDIVQHLPDVVGHEEHKHTPGVFADHDVTVEPESRLGRELGERAPVKSHHHQGLGRLGDGLVETAGRRTEPSRGSRTGAAARAGRPLHPEEEEDAALFRALVEEVAGAEGRHRR